MTLLASLSRRSTEPPTARRAVLRIFLLLLFLAGVSGGAGAVSAQEQDPTRPGPFDFGKMWTFEYPPVEYFTRTYGFDAGPEWFERARLAALRIPGCSASFVSADGLVVTNHHCARGAVSRVTREGEHLLDDGFFATRLEEERTIPGYYADQLLAVYDVTEEIYGAVEGAADREAARARAVEEIRARLQDEHADAAPVRVEIVPLYNGGRYSAYVIRRFTDVRLVGAVELDMGFFGGDPDNFTYPRYALDFAFYRVYGPDGEPYHPRHWFRWGKGVHTGDPVFVIGNPGATNRLKTVAQLEYQRDVPVPQRIHYFQTRVAALRAAYERDPVTGDRLDLRNRAFSLSNALKAYSGRLAALSDPLIMKRKARAEEVLLDSLGAHPDREAEFGEVVGRIAALQEPLRELAPESGAFYRLANASDGSRILRRALRAAAFLDARERGAAEDSLNALRAAVADVADLPVELEEEILADRLADFRRYLGEDDPLVEAALQGRSPEGAATALRTASVAGSAAAMKRALEEGTLSFADPGVALARRLAGRVAAYRKAHAELTRAEQELEAALGRARFAVYGTAVAPDGTSSPRITDGVVKGYPYNGTLAPSFTTFYGMYDRYYGHEQNREWRLTPRWIPVPEALDLATPLNFVSTADTYGGNSGSPAVTPDLEIVGLNFDRNIEGLARDFIYLPERGRNVMVDVRAIEEALESVYHAGHILTEIRAGARRP